MQKTHHKIHKIYRCCLMIAFLLTIFLICCFMMFMYGSNSCEAFMKGNAGLGPNSELLFSWT